MINTGAQTSEGETHVDGVWCKNLRCAQCYTAKAWQDSEVEMLKAEVTAVQSALAASEAAREAVERERNVYLGIAGAAFHGTDHVRKIAEGCNHEYDASTKAYLIWRQDWEDAMAVNIAPLKARAESAERSAREQIADAARYRWLRAQCSEEEFGVYQEKQGFLKPNELDAAIDAAMPAPSVPPEAQGDGDSSGLKKGNPDD